MKHRLILLTDSAFAPDVTARLAASGTAVHIVPAYTLGDVSTALMSEQAHTRIVSFGSGVIVPAAMLRAVGPAYNFHPGPPEYRGLFPSVYALYDNAADFGVTCHEMSTELDAGPIVAAKRFAIPSSADRAQLDAATYIAMLNLVGDLAHALADTSTPLARSSEQWSGPVRRKADFEALCKLPAGADDTEILRRLRAVGEGPYHTLTIEKDGQRIPISSGRTGPVIRGGKPV